MSCALALNSSHALGDGQIQLKVGAFPSCSEGGGKTPGALELGSVNVVLLWKAY